MDFKTLLIYERGRKITLPPPSRSPFEIIKNLEMILDQEETVELKRRNISRKADDNSQILLADYMMT
jgi:hypothetical protein